MTLKSQIDRFSQNESNFNALITGSAGTTVDLGEAGIVKSVATVIGEMAPGVDRGSWATTTAYIINDIVLESGAYYRCRENHTSGTFATDLAAGKWRLNQGGDSEILTHRGRALDDAFTARFETVAAMIADVNLEVGDKVVTYANQNGAEVRQEWDIVAATGTADGGSYIDLTGSGLQAKQIFGEIVTSSQFGTVTSSNFSAFLDASDALHIDTTVLLSGFDMSQSNKKIWFVDGGVISPDTGAATYVLKITGDNNVIYNINGLNTTTNNKKRTLHITGNSNRLYGGAIHEEVKRTDLTVQYDRANVRLDGNDNKIYHADFYNSGFGIDDNGQHNKVKHCDVHDNICGIHMTAGSRHFEINTCQVFNNDVNSDSGADGILGTRNHSRTRIINTDVYANGEHGVYLQGDRFTLDDVRAYSNPKSGIKLASYQTDLVWLAGETPVLRFINGGGVGIDTYVGYSGTVINCYTWDNGSASATDAGIFGQANRLDDCIAHCDVRNENANGIRYVFFESGTEMIQDVIIDDCDVYDVVGTEIQIACDSGLSINNVRTDGTVQTYAVSAGAPTDSPQLIDNTAANLLLSRALRARVTRGTYATINGSSNTGATLDGVTVTSALSTDAWTGISEIINKCKITTDAANTAGLSSTTFSPTTITNSEFSFPAVTSNYPIYVTVAKNGADYSNNDFSAPLITRIMRLGSTFNRSSICSNKFDWNGTSDYTLTVLGDNNVITANIGLDTNNMQIRLDAVSNTNIAVANRATVSDAGTGNVVANNL